MTSAWLIAVVLIGLPAEQPSAKAVPSTEGMSAQSPARTGRPFRGGSELRDAYHHAMRKTVKKAKPDPNRVVPELVVLYTELAEERGMARSEARRMRRGLKLRLEQMRDRLIRETLRRRRDAVRKNRGLRGHRSVLNNSKSTGGGENARALQLIGLIQNTIAPESWDVNGGKGSIRYFSLLKVLVVRQTGEVHHQLGDTLGQLRR